MVPEAELEDPGTGLVPRGAGWFVMNARDARWFEKPGMGHSLPLTGVDEYEAETFFPCTSSTIIQFIQVPLWSPVGTPFPFVP